MPKSITKRHELSVIPHAFNFFINDLFMVFEYVIFDALQVVLQ